MVIMSLVESNIKSGKFIHMLPLDAKREFYLQYHRQYVFKG